MQQLVGLAVLLGSTVAGSQPASIPLTVAEARASMLGRWSGKLEYRDYQAGKWFGLPMKVAISDAGDGVTQLRAADFDDGPKAGTVRITTVSILDARPGVAPTETGASFRKGRSVELETATLTLAPGKPADPSHWTLVATIKGRDDDRPATLRETTVRDGASMITLKEVDFLDDAKEEWLTRNRTTLTRVSD